MQRLVGEIYRVEGPILGQTLTGVETKKVEWRVKFVQKCNLAPIPTPILHLGTRE